MRTLFIACRSLLAFILLASPLVAQAHRPGIAGLYTKSDQGIHAEVQVTPIDVSHAQVAIDVGVPNCAGHVDGVGKVQGSTITLEVPSDLDGMCHVSMTFQGHRILIQERSCLAFHGAACDFQEAGSGIFHHR